MTKSLIAALIVAIAVLSIASPQVQARVYPVKRPANWHRNITDSSSSSHLTPNIVGGSTVPGQTTYPFMVMLNELSQGWFCGGTMIAPNLVLTAAHCAVDTLAANWLVSAYRWDQRLTSPEEGGTDYKVTKIYVHPSYNGDLNTNDVAIFVLSAPLNTPTFPPRWISLNRDPNYPPSGTTSKTIGWGDLQYQGSMPAYLQQVDIPIASVQTCQAVLGSQATYPSMICAGSIGRDSCQGDSGGPLMVNQGGTWVQVGIVSFGTAGCADPKEYLGVYSRVSNLTGWIDSIIAIHAPGVLPGVRQTTKKAVVKATTRKVVQTTKAALCTTVAPCRKARRDEMVVGGGIEDNGVTVTVTVRETVTVVARQ